MRLIPETEVDVLLDGEEHRLTLVASDGGDGRLNVKAPLAVLLGAMAVGSIVKAWTPIAGAETIRVELVAIHA